MRSSVVVVSSVNASFNTTSRNARIHGMDPELYSPRGARPVKAPLRIINPQSYQEFPRKTPRKIIEGKDVTERVPFPRSDTTSGAQPGPTIPRDGTRSRSATSAASSVVGVVPQEGVFTRCFSFLKHIGEDLIMPPYTVDEGLDNIISRKHGHISLNFSGTNIPLV